MCQQSRASCGTCVEASECRCPLLYLTLTQLGPLPSYLRGGLCKECNRAVAELVLDGVLEILCNGRFVSGSEAYERIYPCAVMGEPGGTLARLTRAALEYAQALDIDDSARLSARLYFYNRIPLSARWMSRCHSEEATAAYLGLDKHRKQIERQWSKMQLAPKLHPGAGRYRSLQGQDP